MKIIITSTNQAVKVNNLSQFNDCLIKYSSISDISYDMLEIKECSLCLFNKLMATDFVLCLNSETTRSEILQKLKEYANSFVRDSDFTAYKYDTHGDKHFLVDTNSSKGTKFRDCKQNVNQFLESKIREVRHSIRKHASINGCTNYYLTMFSVPGFCKNDYITVQVTYDVENDTVEYHGYPDDNVRRCGLSYTKGGKELY